MCSRASAVELLVPRMIRGLIRRRWGILLLRWGKQSAQPVGQFPIGQVLTQQRLNRVTQTGVRVAARVHLLILFPSMARRSVNAPITTMAHASALLPGHVERCGHPLQRHRALAWADSLIRGGMLCPRSFSGASSYARLTTSSRTSTGP